MSEVTTRTRTCDQCGADLTRANGPYPWHFVLSGEFTPSTSQIRYDPHPRPDPDRHFCDRECLSRFVGKSFGGEVSYEMFDKGGNMILDAGLMVGAGEYGARRKLAQEIFQEMWVRRPTQIGADARKPETNI